MLAPIIIFAFNRPDRLQAMIKSLNANSLYDDSDKFVFVDGPRNDVDAERIKEVVTIARNITNNVKASSANKGLGTSIIEGVTSIINKYGKAIVLEDDLILMPGFLTFMNQCLDTYESDSRIFSVCGYGLKINRPEGYQGDVYLSLRSSSWGWATWADRWNSVDWQVTDYETLRSSRRMRRAFNRGGSDMYGMLRDYMEGRNHSWAIRFCYSQFKQGKYSVHPFLSFVDNEGFGSDATNCCQTYSRFKTELNTGTKIMVPSHLQVEEKLIKQLRRYHSIRLRIYSKIRKMLEGIKRNRI